MISNLPQHQLACLDHVRSCTSVVLLGKKSYRFRCLWDGEAQDNVCCSCRCLPTVLEPEKLAVQYWKSKIARNFAPVLVIISGNFQAFFWKISNTTVFYRCCAPASQHQYWFKMQMSSHCSGPFRERQRGVKNSGRWKHTIRPLWSVPSPLSTVCHVSYLLNFLNYTSE